jgi:hypothetical protein
MQSVAVAKLAREQIEKEFFKGNITDQLIKDRMVDIINDPQMSKQASQMAEDWAFNHRNLSKFEKGTLNRMFLFYGWPKNLVKMAFWTIPAKNPLTGEALQAISRMGNDVWMQRVKDFGASERDIDWMRANHLDLLFPVRRDDKNQTIDFVGLPGVNIFNTVLRLSRDSVPSHLAPLARIMFRTFAHQDIMGGGVKMMQDPAYHQDSSGHWWHIKPDGTAEPSNGPIPSTKQEVWDNLPWVKVEDLSRGKGFRTDKDGNPILDKHGQPIMNKTANDQIWRNILGYSKSHFDISPEAETRRAEFENQFVRGFYKQENKLNNYYQMKPKESE